MKGPRNGILPRNQWLAIWIVSVWLCIASGPLAVRRSGGLVAVFRGAAS